MGAEAGGRRLAAILAADVSGYSRLIGADEPGTLAKLAALRSTVIDPQMAEYGGRVFKTTGDGLLAEFPSAVQALRCAIAIQQELRGAEDGLQLRIGLHAADVVVQGGDLFGDGVNVAARLEAIAEAGGICISARVREDAAGKIPLDVEDIGTPALKNIAQPVRVFRVRLDPPERPQLALPDKPSIAVLPFQNMSGDPEQEYFADGMVEDITTALSRIGGLFVIARNSAFAYKGKSPDVRQVGRELGARYVLEGSVRKSGDRVRITAQLIEAATGGHVWADRFDDNYNDIFELQDRITGRVVGALEPNLQKAEIIRATRKPTEKLDAYDLYLRALQQTHLSTASSNPEARRLLRQAIAMDRKFGLAKALYATCVGMAVTFDLVAWGGDEALDAVKLAREALTDSPDDPTAVSLAGWAIDYLDHDLVAAQAALERAMALNANSVGVHRASGWVHLHVGEFAVARDHFIRAMRLSPIDPEFGTFQLGLAIALLWGDPPEPESALGLANKALDALPRHYVGLQVRIYCLVTLGRVAQAKQTAQVLLDAYPNASLSSWRRRWAYSSEELKEKQVEAYRLAGIPE